MVMRRPPWLSRRAAASIDRQFRRCQSLRQVVRIAWYTAVGVQRMSQRTLGTLTIGQAPRPDVVPIIDRYVPASVRRVHRGVLDGLSHSEIAARYRPEAGEPALVTRIEDGTVV